MPFSSSLSKAYSLYCFIARERNSERNVRSIIHAMPSSEKPMPPIMSRVPKPYLLLPAMRSVTSFMSHEITIEAAAERNAAITVITRLNLFLRNSSLMNGRRNAFSSFFVIFESLLIFIGNHYTVAELITLPTVGFIFATWGFVLIKRETERFTAMSLDRPQRRLLKRRKAFRSQARPRRYRPRPSRSRPCYRARWHPRCCL